ncbi:putative c6 zinc finger domain-containing protein [Phaeoacremonium minimum UCRPA7]|uniref:Putative c6 zinc finger domain-containing protein n=1 Tax=Phaeoacremonium minimum (strain UCR-PA7) TaxID=1286976 RepID=R8BMH5_PHAM7|nr:putative c6 zinc finger domain-containing protein [Phaeoacremonium minimum UCRPA7]EOO00588.1 putative c6 zinc finger domain-containing protein [Phaeoacremonium minimum UCRPA7]
MIMTLLLVTFEFLQGNMKAADHLMAGGIQLLKDNLTILQGAAGRPRSKKLTSDEFEDVEHMLPRLSVSSSVTHFCNLQSRQFAELRGSGVGSLPDADGQTGLPRLLALWSEFSTRALVFVCQSFRNQLLQLKYDVTEVEERQTQLLLRLRQWRALLDQYLVGAKSETVRYSLKMLIPHWLMVYIFTSCVLDPTDLSYDHFEPEFREINTRCAELLAMEIYQEGSATAQSFRNKIKFSLGDGLITPLALVIGKCRIHDVRMEAAEMFRLLPREAAWDAQALIIGKLGLVLMEERARVIHGYVPSNSRWFWTGGEWDIDNRVLHSRYVRIVPAEDGSPIHLGMTLDLDSLPDICGEVGCTKDHSYLPLRHARSGLRDVMH